VPQGNCPLRRMPKVKTRPRMALTLLALFRKYPDANRSQIVALAGFDPIRRLRVTKIRKIKGLPLYFVRRREHLR